MKPDITTAVPERVRSHPSKDNAEPAKSFPLALAQDGERVRILSLRSGKGLNRKLGALGLHIGSTVTVTQRQRNGAVVVARKGNRVALGAATAQMILVALEDDTERAAP